MPRHFYKPIDCRLINAGLIGLLLAVITAGTASAKLRSFAPSWVEEFPQQDCRVVYIASVPLAEELADSRVDAERCRAIRATYPQSGVYTRSEPPKLLWQLDISEMDGPVYLSSDGSSLTAVGDFLGSYDWYEDTIATFQRRGEAPHVVRYRDIAAIPELKRAFATRGNNYLSGLDARYNTRSDTLVVTTNAGETITLDGRTGDVVQYKDPFFVKCALAFLLAVAIAVFFLVRNLRKHLAPARAP